MNTARLNRIDVIDCSCRRDMMWINSVMQQNMNSTDVIAVLMKGRASINSMNELGSKPIDVARRHIKKAAVSMLEQL